MARSNVPKFGDWNAEEDVSYTTYFENTRKVSSSEKDQKVNPNASPGNPYAIPKQDALRTPEAAKVSHTRKVSQEEGEFRRAAVSPSRLDARRRTSGDSAHQQSVGVGGNTPKRAPRPNGGSVRSADHSPLHPYYQAKVAGRESATSSSSWERRHSSEAGHGVAPSTPGRSRLKSVPRGNETPDRGVASVPKFGAWDETDPSSADGFTQIFNKVKEERHGGVGTETHSNGQKQYRSKESKGCCCFPWG